MPLWSAKDPNSRRSRKRLVLRTIVVSGGGLCLVVILLLVLQSAAVRSFALRRLTEYFAAQRIELRIDDLQYNLFRLSVELRNLRVRSTSSSDLQPFATIGHARLDLSLTDLLRRRYVVESASVEDVDLSYIVDASGRDNLPRIPARPDTPRTPIDVSIAKASAGNVRVRYADMARRVDLVLPLSNVQITGNAITGRHQVRIEGTGGRVQLQGRAGVVDKVTAVVDVGRDDLSVDRFQIEALGSRAAVTGTVHDFDAPTLATTLQSTINTERAAAFLSVDDSIKGSITIDGTANGPLSAPIIEARVTGSALQVRSLGDTRLDAQAAYDFGAGQARMSSVNVQGPWGGLVADGELTLGPEGTSRLRGQLTNIDVAAIMRGLYLSHTLETRATGKFDAQWPGLDYLSASGTAAVSLTPTRMMGGLPVTGRLSARGTGRAIAVDLEEVSAAGAHLAGRVQVDPRRSLQGDVRVSTQDVGATTTALERFLKRAPGTLLSIPLAGAAFIDARLKGTIDRPVTEAKVVAPALSAAGANGLAIGATMTVTPEVITIARGDANWNGAHARVAGTMQLAGNQRLDLAVDGSAPDLRTLVTSAKGPEPGVAGAVTVRGTVRGSFARPLASATFSGTDIVAFGERFGSVEAEANLDGPEATLSYLVVDKPQPDGAGRINATGSYNLSRESYSFNLESKNLRLLGLTLPDGRQIRAAIQLSARGTGTRRSPAATANLVFDQIELDGLGREPEYASSSHKPTQLGRVLISTTVANHQATVDASAEHFKLDASASVALARPWQTSLIVRANDLELEQLPFSFKIPVAGRLRAAVNATGNLAEPLDARATADIETLTGTWNGQPFSVASQRGLRYESQRVQIDHLVVTSGESSLLVRGQLPITSTAQAGDLDLEARADLGAMTRLLPPGVTVKAGGAMTLTGSIRGTLKSMTPNLLLTVENGALTSPDFVPGASDIQLRARMGDGVVEVEQLNGRWGSAIINGSATVPLEALPPLPLEIARRGGPATVKASVRNLDPATIPGAPAGLAGQVDVDIDASATRADLSTLDGRIDFPQLELTLKRLTLSQQDRSRITISSGKASMERLALSGTAGNVAVHGTLGLAGERTVDVSVDGALNVGVLSALSEKVRTDGVATVKLAARGSAIAPELHGTLDLKDGTVAIDDLRVAATAVNAHVDLSGATMDLTKLSGEVNGGAVEGSGRVTLANGTIGDIDLQLSAKDFAYDAPLDLRSLSTSTIRINRRGEEFLVSGQVTVNEAGLTSDINLDQGLFAAISAPRTTDVTRTRNPFLERVRFNLGVVTAAPVMIDNNLARAEVETDVRIVGTPYEPGLTGRLTLVNGGQITLNARRYEVERGIVTFLEDRRIVPSIDLVLNTKASNYDVRITVTGTPGKTETTWTSEPPLPEPDIMALVVTGRTVDEMRGEESEVARVQALSYLTGRVGSKFGRNLERATGISEVRIEPVLIANETDPTARLTVGQNITDQVKLVYSTNLADSNDQIWVAEYEVTRRFEMRGVRERDDDSYRVDFRHDVRFGGSPAPRRDVRRRPTVTSLAVSVDAGFDESRIRELFKLKVGDAYEYFDARRGLERIDKLYLESGYLQARVRLDRRIESDQAHLTLHVSSGPVVDLHFEGATPPSKVQQNVRLAWHHGVFDRQRGNDGARVVREWLMLDKHLEPQVAYEITENGDRRRVVFRMQPGPKYERISLAFEGAVGIAPDRLNRIIAQQHLENQLFTDPIVVTDLLERYYREQGYLSAEIDAPRYEFQATNARVVLPVREGPRFTVGQLTTSGNTVYASDEIVKAIAIDRGAPFVSAAAEHALDRIRDLYWRKGYNDMRSEYALVVNRPDARVDLSFTIVEGRQNVVADISVTGNQRTSEQLIRREVELEPLQPLDLAVLARSRRNLYSTGAFSIADITREAAHDAQLPASDAAPEAQSAQDATPKPIDLNVLVREVQPVQLRYGLSYDTEGGLGGILDLSVRNMLNRARVFGAQGRYDSEIHEGRLYVSQPSLRSWPRKTTAGVYFRKDLNPPTDHTDPFDISRQGASIQQEVQFHRVYVWSYGYRYELATTLEPSLGEGVTETVRVTPLSATLRRETRDEVLDASKGTFASQAFAYSPSWLGSDKPYVKYYGQYFHYFPLRPEKPKPFTNEVLRARLVFATGIRIGLAHGLDGDVPTSERFYAGGSTTLRGFEQNTVGPVGVNNVPAGGNAVLVFNNELRMPLVRILDGVVFLDVGNVFPAIKDFSFTDVRESAGVGLRVRTPWILLRTDYGFVLDPRPGEKRSRFYFSIGQAF